ncbi:hypothetical protein NC653_015376 [Populus alba x Populus x berolinensis]|uniref:CASP-like protein n=1 Tax=Populus alba x Populus x berolinensis TaxID=444605 RepID=A0AAD6QKK8_9ROSI|nr:hypothetical protein NC653_015376 [Populus alba x Populus x berolinensis]
MSYLGVGVSPGNVPVYHGINLKILKLKKSFQFQKKARFTDMKALVFLVVANGIAAAYSLVQGVRCVVGMV